MGVLGDALGALLEMLPLLTGVSCPARWKPRSAWLAGRGSGREEGTGQLTRGVGVDLRRQTAGLEGVVGLEGARRRQVLVVGWRLGFRGCRESARQEKQKGTARKQKSIRSGMAELQMCSPIMEMGTSLPQEEHFMVGRKPVESRSPFMVWESTTRPSRGLCLFARVAVEGSCLDGTPSLVYACRGSVGTMRKRKLSDEEDGQGDRATEPNYENNVDQGVQSGRRTLETVYSYECLVRGQQMDRGMGVFIKSMCWRPVSSV